MKIEYDPGLIEEVVFKTIKLREEKGDNVLSDEYHALTDPIYENFPLEERSVQFRKVEWDFFKKLGFSKLIEEAFKEYPQVEGKVAGGVIAKAKNTQDEGSNLVKSLDASGKKRIIVKLLPDRFHEGAVLQKILHHELMHVMDMLDDTFGYRDERLGVNPMEENIICDRYKTFWDIFVDSRLVKQGKETVVSKEGRYQEFDALYQSFPLETKRAIFNTLWEDGSLTHDKILELAEDVNKVMAIADKGGQPGRTKKSHLLGAQCPLCQFRTYDWVEDPEQEPHLVKAIQEEFPNWVIDDGVCERCAEVYKLQSVIS